MNQRAPGFRPDVEGLRAIAVLMILGYHAHVPGITGGYVGVDVFFVISGFLITGLIARELAQTGTVSLTAFYARRARRLLPAALAVIGVIVVASAIVLPSIRMPGVVGDASAAALYVANIRFAVQATDYLQAGSDPSPLLHYWSIGVEEHFYLLWPALLALVWRLGSSRVRGAPAGRIVGVVVLTAIVSFVISIVLTDADAPLAFYLLPARAWELAAGGLVALVVDRAAGSLGPADLVGPRLAGIAVSAGARFGALRVPAVLLAVVGVGLVGFAAVRFGDTTAFPGAAALAPVLGIVLVLATGGTGTATVVHRVLATAPLRWIGRISYSLYLWHWPLLALPTQVIGHGLPAPARLALVALAFPVAALSERFIERPIRSGGVLRMRPGRTVAFAGIAGLVTAIAVAGVGIAVAPPSRVGAATGTPPPLVLPTAPAVVVGNSASPGSSPTTVPSPAPRPTTAPGPVPADLIPPLGDARSDLPVIYRDGCHLAATDTKSGACAYADTSSSTVVVLFGDSHAAQWFATIEQIAIDRGWRLELLTKASCVAADITVWSPSLVRPYTECDKWRAAALERIKTEKPALVIVSNTRYINLVVEGKPVASLSEEARWDAALERTLADLHRSAGDVVLLGDTPNPDINPLECLDQNPDDALACTTPLESSVTPARIAAEGQLSARAGAVFVDPTAWVCPSDPCPAVIGRYLVYRDSGHLATSFARALAPYLEAALPPVP